MVVCKFNCKTQKKLLHYYWLFFVIIFLNNFSRNNIIVGSAADDDHDQNTFLPKNVVVPAILGFGDSIIDPGNNNYLKTLVKCDFPPYGRDFNGGLPTGRFSNGRIPTDIIAEEIGIKKLVPAYLDPKLTNQELLTGVSFASGASGYDPLTSMITSVLSLDDQINLFKEYIKRIKAIVGEERTATILSTSIILICVGSDDIANTYYITPFRRVEYDVPAYTDLMAESAAKFLQQIYMLGGRKIGVLSLPAIGCVPSQRTLGGGLGRGCSEDANQAAVLFNQKLSSLIGFMGEKYSDAKFVYLDIYNPFLELIQNPAKYGFEVGDKGCCGTGNIEVSILCNSLSIETCEDADKYIFWDSYHPTEKAYKILSPQILRNGVNKFF